MPYKEKNKKTWMATVTFREQRFVSRQATKRAALEWEQEKKAELKKIPVTRMAFSVLVNEYLDFVTARYTKFTYKEKVRSAKRLRVFLGGDVPLDEITPKIIQKHLLVLAGERSNNVANRQRKNLLAMWTWGRKILDIEENPISKIEKFPHDKQPQYTPSEEDVLKVMLVVQGQDKVLVEAYLNTGARRSEIFRLTWDDVNFEKSEIRLWTRKTKDGSLVGEWIAMNKRLADHLYRWFQNTPFKDRPEVFICDQVGPHYGHPFKWRRTFMRSICERAGVKPFGFHALRRFFASLLYDKHKVSKPTIQGLLRHKSPTTTDRYLQGIMDGQREAVDLLFEEKKYIPTIHTKQKRT